MQIDEIPSCGTPAGARRRVRGLPGAPRRTRSGGERDSPPQSRPLLAPFHALVGDCAGEIRGRGRGHRQWAGTRTGRPDGPDGGRDWGSRGALAPGVSPRAADIDRRGCRGGGRRLQCALAGLTFVLEELQRHFAPTVFGATFMAVLTADVVTRSLTSQLPVFHVASPPPQPLLALLVFLVLGLLTGVLGVAFNRGLPGGGTLRGQARPRDRITGRVRPRLHFDCDNPTARERPPFSLHWYRTARQPLALCI